MEIKLDTPQEMKTLSDKDSLQLKQGPRPSFSLNVT